MARSIIPCHRASKGRAEVDFIIEDGMARAVPIEVKSSGNVRSRSLSVYCEKHQPARALRLSAKIFGYDGLVRGVPFYAAFCIGRNGSD